MKERAFKFLPKDKMPDRKLFEMRLRALEEQLTSSQRDFAVKAITIGPMPTAQVLYSNVL